MKKVALIFVLAVILPSLALAWLAVRSLRDQQFVLERQQSLLYQGVTDALAKDITDYLSDQQRDFSTHVQQYLSGQIQQYLSEKKLHIGDGGAEFLHSAGAGFDNHIRKQWPLAEVGFCVSSKEGLLSPSPTSRPEARMFCADHGGFLVNRDIAEVYWNNVANHRAQPVFKSASGINTFQKMPLLETNLFASKAQPRKINPMQQQAVLPVPNELQAESLNFSKVVAADAEFRVLIGDAMDGMLARFVQDKLRLMFWHREPHLEPLEQQTIFGAQLDLARVVEGLKERVKAFEPAYREGIAFAVLDDKAKPVAISSAGFQANWKRPFVATEIGQALPHWEAAVYLTDPGSLARSASTMRLTLGLLIALFVVAIGAGSWLIVSDLNRQLTLARQKTDFVSNVSHELKTPLTSIRMFSEMLAEGRVTGPDKQRSFLNIITAETARLTRLINNVLDFSRMERGEKKYSFASGDLAEVVRETAETFRPHLESNGFRLNCAFPESPQIVNGDRDALAQVVVNLLSNAEKYSNGQKEIELQIERHNQPKPSVEVRVMDRGMGVPRGCEEKIFEQFYRAHDSLNSGIQGSGLGLTLARQIARAHGGDVTCEPRDGGGSCFVLRLPVKPA
jgi:signal transduction histidine kinase